MIHCPTAVSYTSLTVDKIIIMKPCLKATREGAGEKLVMLESVFFPLNFRAWRVESMAHRESFDHVDRYVCRDCREDLVVWLGYYQLIFFVHLLPLTS